jgi:hypothetical protein
VHKEGYISAVGCIEATGMSICRAVPESGDGRGEVPTSGRYGVVQLTANLERTTRITCYVSSAVMPS